MNEQIDWSKAPEGATHWEPSSGGVTAGWMRLENDIWYFWPTGRWDSYEWNRASAKTNSRSGKMIPRTTTPSWSGEGLPPVGAVCRIITDDSAWWKYSGLTDGEDVTVCHSFKNSKGCDMVVVEACNGACLAVTVECVAPSSTPEQIAPDEREAAVNDMHAIYMKGAVHGGGLYAIYDAGYRKQDGK